ncbi:MlaD family protein [Noviherbaspirillum massiliense]|uniref:MlaD family protein n=1 Tax=Noviherbaspirillum massiliense TaxID=1465823 RepID=UPI0002F28DBA|nr:MlaD family protein [Noviherbaspirillum massiliense]
MENKSHALLAGAFTIALLVATVLAALWLNRDRVEWVPYQIATKLSIPGLSPQAAVRYRGLDVGKVENIEFDPEVPGQILVDIGVRPDTPVTESTFAILNYQGVTGIAYVQLDDDSSRPVRVRSGPDHVARIEMRPSLIDQLQNRGLAILQQTEEVARKINDLLAPANQKSMLAAFNNVSKTANEFEDIPRRLQPTLAKLPSLAEQTQQALDSITALSTEAHALTGNLNGIATQLRTPNGPLERLSTAVDQFGSVASRFEQDVLPLTSEARTSMRALNRALDNFTDRPQSVLFGSPAVQPGPGEAGFSAPHQ